MSYGILKTFPKLGERIRVDQPIAEEGLTKLATFLYDSLLVKPELLTEDSLQALQDLGTMRLFITCVERVGRMIDSQSDVRTRRRAERMYLGLLSQLSNVMHYSSSPWDAVFGRIALDIQSELVQFHTHSSESDAERKSRLEELERHHEAWLGLAVRMRQLFAHHEPLLGETQVLRYHERIYDFIWEISPRWNKLHKHVIALWDHPFDSPFDVDRVCTDDPNRYSGRVRTHVTEHTLRPSLEYSRCAMERRRREIRAPTIVLQSDPAVVVFEAALFHHYVRDFSSDRSTLVECQALKDLGVKFRQKFSFSQGSEEFRRSTLRQTQSFVERETGGSYLSFRNSLPEDCRTTHERLMTILRQQQGTVQYFVLTDDPCHTMGVLLAIGYNCVLSPVDFISSQQLPSLRQRHSRAFDFLFGFTNRSFASKSKQYRMRQLHITNTSSLSHLMEFISAAHHSLS